jgi:hypothetical protein
LRRGRRGGRVKIRGILRGGRTLGMDCPAMAARRSRRERTVVIGRTSRTRVRRQVRSYRRIHPIKNHYRYEGTLPAMVRVWTIRHVLRCPKNDTAMLSLRGPVIDSQSSRIRAWRHARIYQQHDRTRNPRQRRVEITLHASTVQSSKMYHDLRDRRTCRAMPQTPEREMVDRSTRIRARHHGRRYRQSLMVKDQPHQDESTPHASTAHGPTKNPALPYLWIRKTVSRIRGLVTVDHT